ncbi:AEC family transporter [Companilactobacillus nodensis]|uniref:Auxin Efflux Carrier n=1 Tax=Companilactobacillus nodensis DSM 19682 = JCM 14932 = NBRC 107160 TaxID=1423775 RepID=A0A0R1K9L9_9LACO|nr:AEC family transporter [Companilactobacillus nodensis]KRK80390.1 Auxin Efflux Carrier [Companilactobacillus nodensis DSM 19682 = JCM 14932 = NBRC 107160]
MLKTVIFALLPIIVTILLGMWAAHHGDFDEKDSNKLIKLIMNYALPMNVFAGIWGTPRKIIVEDIPLALWLLGSMFICYIVLSFVQTKIMKTSTNVATLRALSVADPSVPFIGSAVLPLIFGENLSAINIGISSLIINVVLLPFVFAALVSDDGNDKDITIGARLMNSLKKPLVLSALLGFALALLGLQMPTELESTFTVLGKSSGGVAMFATGIILFSKKIHFNKTIATSVLGKNVLFPAIVWGLMVATGMPLSLQRIVIITLAIPTATMPTNLAIQYKVDEFEMASIQLWSTVLSFVTLSSVMLMLG